jgi:3-isopropylmalate/(R)-2-methylmalate dehydratase small subunit
MTPLRVLDAPAVPLDESDIDTDQLAPGRLLLGPLTPTLLLHDRRFAPDGTPRAEFPLNDPAYAGAEIIVARRNFGIGSSREYAARALPAAGFRCVIAASFGDIFYNNCLQVGVLPIALEETAIDLLLSLLQAHPGMHVQVDVAEQLVSAPEFGPHRFALNAMRRQCLLEGLDELALTGRYDEAIVAFEERYYRDRPWFVTQP